MRLNTIVNGLIGAGIALAPLNANAQTDVSAQTPTSYAKGTSQYALLESVANEAFRDGKKTAYKRGSDEKGWKEVNCYRLTFVAPSGMAPDTMGVEVYDWDKSRTLSNGDVVAMGTIRPMSGFDEYHPSYMVTSTGFAIKPSKSAEREKWTAVNVLAENAPEKRIRVTDAAGITYANAAFKESEAQLARLQKLRNK